ncbi:MAG: transglutaminase-like domain-containing protein, partial [Patescibacteria group bacterium]|nr:transglutaminase-like domain-containing protein [Patescibacteria group bacterium]
KKYSIFKIIIFILSFFFFVFSNKIFASDYKTDYQVNYDLKNFSSTQEAKVDFNIKITNLRSDIYVSKFSISFPNSFYISNIKAFDDYGEVVSKISSNNDYTKVEMEFSNPNIGKNLVNNLYLKFNQKNLFKINGQIWEVVLPVLEKKEDDTYKIKVILPQNSDKKISIAKPKPNYIYQNEIIWENPKTKTIYAVFGDYQVYKTELSYNLKNSEVFPVFKEIAFPPDTLYQKIIIQSIDPAPFQVYQDIDGNYLGKYFLKPFESKKIIFRGYIQVFAKPREEIIKNIRENFESQKKYLLRNQPYWSVKKIDEVKIKDLKTISDIYYFVVNNLEYNYDKLKSENKRIGAEKILENPSYAVCLEFSDLFVALAREKGFFARQVNGYGFSFDPKLQPLSLNNDVLHAWPEYYDEFLGFWISVDPTWEKTSGIDYFSSFDLNHIVFSIHGKSSDYPLPAGMYKVDNSKDIIVNPSFDLLKDFKKITIKDFSFYKNKNNKNYNYKINFKIKNEGNIYSFKIPVKIENNNLNFEKNYFLIDSLAPFEEKKIEVNFYYPKKISFKEKKEKIILYVDNQKIFEDEIKISFFVFIFFKKIILTVVILFIIGFLIKKIFKND